MDEPSRMCKTYVRAEVLGLGLLSVFKMPGVEVMVTPDITGGGDFTTALNDRVGEFLINGVVGIQFAPNPFAE